MSNLSNKHMRNSRSDYYNASRGGAVPNDYHDDYDNRWGLRHAGSWPSDWAPRRTCQMCKKQFRTDNGEGFSSFLVDICAPCIHRLVKKEKSTVTVKDVEFTPRIDEIRTQ